MLSTEFRKYKYIETKDQSLSPRRTATICIFSEFSYRLSSMCFLRSCYNKLYILLFSFSIVMQAFSYVNKTLKYDFIWLHNHIDET